MSHRLQPSHAYGRQSVAPYRPSIELLLDATTRQPSWEWETTLFAAAIDAAKGKGWPVLVPPSSRVTCVDDATHITAILAAYGCKQCSLLTHLAHFPYLAHGSHGPEQCTENERYAIKLRTYELEGILDTIGGNGFEDGVTQQWLRDHHKR